MDGQEEKPEAEGRRRAGVLSAMWHRDYALFWTGALVSNIGTWIQSTALMWHVKTTTQSNAWVGAVNLANYLPVLLFSLIAGFAADALDRKRVVLFTFSMMLACALALGLCTTFGVATMPVVIALVFISGTAYTFCADAGVALLPYLVPERDMMNALALSSAQFNIGRVVGPALGALVLSVWSVSTAYYLNAVSFMFIIIAIGLTRPRLRGGSVPLGNAAGHIAEGFRYLRRHAWMIWVLVTLGLFTFFGFSQTVLYPGVARNVLGMSSGAYGFLMSFLGLGAALGAPLLTALHRSLPERVIIKGCALGSGLLLIGLSLSRELWLSCVLSAGIGCAFLMMGTSVNTVLQARSPHEMRGRVVSFYMMMWLGTFPIGGQLMGLLADRYSTPATIMAGGAVCTVLAVLLLAFPRLTGGASSELGPGE